MIMLDADEVRKATPRILARYHIPRDRTRGPARFVTSAAARDAVARV